MMIKIKPAGRVLKGETILIKGLRWKVDKVEHLNSSVLFFSLTRTEKSKSYFMGHSRHINTATQWAVTK